MQLNLVQHPLEKKIGLMLTSNSFQPCLEKANSCQKSLSLLSEELVHGLHTPAKGPSTNTQGQQDASGDSSCLEFCSPGYLHTNTLTSHEHKSQNTHTDHCGAMPGLKYTKSPSKLRSALPKLIAEKTHTFTTLLLSKLA